MDQTKIIIGNWVEVFDKKSQRVLTGYVISMNTNEAHIYIPQRGKVYRLHKSLIACRENVELNQQDLRTLIDLALDYRDFSWLSKLVSSLNQLNFVKEKAL